MRISAVIPTRNRPDSLLRTVASLLAQSRPPIEIIIVDSSDQALDTGLLGDSDGIEIHHLRSAASVCAQRNIGIGRALGDYTLLCDDDIELPEEYLQVLGKHVERTAAVAVSGLGLQSDADGQWVHHYPVKSFARLIYLYVFQLGVWGDVQQVRAGPPLRWLRNHIVKHYERRSNSLSLAGWPLFTDIDDDVIHTRIYGLCASLIKTSWLTSNRFDEVLDRHGLGDNYGVAIGLPDNIHVLKETVYYHHQEPVNRLAAQLTSYRRILALHYFLHRRCSFIMRVMLQWSLFGKLLAELYGRSSQARGTAKAMLLILIKCNPYVVGNARDQKCVEPEL